ncbi:peptidase U32 family protein [Clostridium mediterraneense]|uniref:peptidase U32 family protein n=1 Tax=Clostridium mediterraneense TaxID=1805472 RepID=UPI000831D5B8|nr:U32 family peptidase [Clostridium mediterraneense]
MRKPEILAPGGNLTKLKTAIDFGADAVYIGGSKLNLRAFADNFTNEQIAEGVKYAHERGRKVYVTMNVFPHNADLHGLEEYIEGLAKLNVDAIIVADPSIIVTAKQVAPELEIHLSTQANNVNWRAAKFWYDQGVKRIVLARELSFREIKSIKENLPEECDLEAFVHGSMCMAYSGRCLISNYMTGRDANRGACSQACRYKYHLVEEKRPGEYYPVVEDENGTYIMNSKDLCMIEYIPEIVESGIYSLKIEGRMKSEFYVASIVKAYREALDAYWENPAEYKFNPKWMEILLKISHRKYHTGFYFGKSESQVYETSAYVRDYDIIGTVLSYDEETKIAVIEQRNRVFEGDEVEVLRAKGDFFTVKLDDMHDENDEKIDVANKAKMIFKIKSEKKLEAKDMLIKSKEAKANE